MGDVYEFKKPGDGGAYVDVLTVRGFIDVIIKGSVGSPEIMGFPIYCKSEKGGMLNAVSKIEILECKEDGDCVFCISFFDE